MIIKQLSSVALLFIGSSFAFADTVTVPGQSQIWQTWTLAQLNNNGSPYWDNASWDGGNKNIGFCLTNSANCGVHPVPGVLPYAGQSNGNAFSDFYFNGSGAAVTATFEAQLAGDAGYDEIGWYNILNPSEYGVIFSGVTAAGATDTFTPSAKYGLFLYDSTPSVNEYYLSQSSSDLSMDQWNQHFAVFNGGAGTYFVGAEDLPSCHTDFDENDMVIKLSTTVDPVCPEPAAMALVGTGLMGLGIFFRRKKAVQNA